MEQVIQWGMLSETSIVTNVYEINPYKHLLLKLSLLLADCISIVIREDHDGFAGFLAINFCFHATRRYDALPLLFARSAGVLYRQSVIGYNQDSLNMSSLSLEIGMKPWNKWCNYKKSTALN